MSSFIVALDTPVTVTLEDKATGLEVDRQIVKAENLDGHVFLLGYMWNALTVSGGVAWRHPATGKAYPQGLRLKCYVVHPDTGETVEVSNR